MTVELEVQRATDGAGVDLPTDDDIEGWVRATLAGRKPAAQLVVRIVDETESGELNERYRHRAGATNVLSFPFERPELLDPPLLGDIVVCAPVVGREAVEQHKPAGAHWAHMVVHGVLHLIGYDHEAEQDAEEMEALERQILAALGFDDPYAVTPLQDEETEI